jgi:hypothetical protein
MISNHQQNNHFTSIDNHPLKNLWVKSNFVLNSFDELNYLGEQLRSPTFEPKHDSNSTKPKWEIRLPQLLNTTVGPDRQVISHLQNISSSFI